jgi:ribonuclease P protein component
LSRLYTLGKKERLKSRKKIEALFSSGQRFTMVPFLVYYRVHKDEVQQTLQAGVSASKKNFRKAVDRNRVKRILREAYRLQKLELKERIKSNPKSLDLFIIYTGKTIPVYSEVFEKLKPVLQKLNELYEKA